MSQKIPFCKQLNFNDVNCLFYSFDGIQIGCSVIVYNSPHFIALFETIETLRLSDLKEKDQVIFLDTC